MAAAYSSAVFLCALKGKGPLAAADFPGAFCVCGNRRFPGRLFLCLRKERVFGRSRSLGSPFLSLRKERVLGRRRFISRLFSSFKNERAFSRRQFAGGLLKRKGPLAAAGFFGLLSPLKKEWALGRRRFPGRLFLSSTSDRDFGHCRFLSSLFHSLRHERVFGRSRFSVLDKGKGLRPSLFRPPFSVLEKGKGLGSCRFRKGPSAAAGFAGRLLPCLVSASGAEGARASRGPRVSRLGRGAGPALGCDRVCGRDEDAGTRGTTPASRVGVFQR